MYIYIYINIYIYIYISVNIYSYILIYIIYVPLVLAKQLYPHPLTDCDDAGFSEVPTEAGGIFSKICTHFPAKTLMGQHTWIFHISFNQ